MRVNQPVKYLLVTAVLCCWFLNSYAQVDAISPGTMVGGNSPVECPSMRVERAVFLVEHDKGSGSGFLMQDAGQVYFVSNIHVMEGGENFSIRNVYGETVTVPAQVEVASDRDLIRFPVSSYNAALLISPDFGFGDKVCALGNSGGEGVITRLDGEIMALGPDKVEVSSEFIPGNSGGPVLSESNQVVGVSTYLSRYGSMPDWIIEGTRFEGTRRMAVRVDNVEWVSMTWDELCCEAAYVNEIENYSYEAVMIVESLSTNAYEMIYSNVDHSGLQKWLQQHNQNVRKVGSRLKKVTTGYSIKYEVSSSMERKFREEISLLADLFESFERGASRTGKVSTPYFEERLESYRRYFDSSRKHMETVVETMF